MKKRNAFLEILDSLFIMVLCFGTLLTAMLMKGNVSLSYTIHMNTFLAVIIGLIVCLAFILSNSEKGLKKIIDHLYQTVNS